MGNCCSKADEVNYQHKQNEKQPLLREREEKKSSSVQEHNAAVTDSGKCIFRVLSRALTDVKLENSNIVKKRREEIEQRLTIDRSKSTEKDLKAPTRKYFIGTKSQTILFKDNRKESHVAFLVTDTPIPTTRSNVIDNYNNKPTNLVKSTSSSSSVGSFEDNQTVSSNTHLT